MFLISFLCAPFWLTLNTDSNSEHIAKLVCLACMDLLLAGKYSRGFWKNKEKGLRHFLGAQESKGTVHMYNWTSPKLAKKIECWDYLTNS